MRRASVWILLACLCIPSFALYRGEKYREDLHIQPLRDGRVSTTFSFVTVLEGAVPRNPKALGQLDECRSTIATSHSKNSQAVQSSTMPCSH
jgi:phosphatidylinositol glycan class T